MPVKLTVTIQVVATDAFGRPAEGVPTSRLEWVVTTNIGDNPHLYLGNVADHIDQVATQARTTLRQMNGTPLTTTQRRG